MALLDLTIEEAESTFSPKVVLFGVEEGNESDRSSVKMKRGSGRKMGKRVLILGLLVVVLVVAFLLYRRR